MRAALNIVFGILLLVTQAMASVTPHTEDKEAVCQCCSCGSKACPTASQPAPASAPSPLTSQQQAANETERVSLPERQPAIGIAPRQTGLFLSLAESPSHLSGQPLYERFCALLI